MVTHDWDLCSICQSKESYNPIMNPASSVKLRTNPERLSACYKEVTDNIQELMVKRELPYFVIVDNIGRGSGANNIVQLIMSTKVVWHKTCWTAVDS